MPDNQCANCGQWSGSGHRCPTSTPTTRPTTPERRTPDGQTSSGPETTDRVARAQAALAAAQAELAAAEAEARRANEANDMPIPVGREELSNWFDRGVDQNAEFMVVVVDGFDYEDYPVYVTAGEDVNEVVRRYDGMSMQRVMEVYSLRSAKGVQMNEYRARHTTHFGYPRPASEPAPTPNLAPARRPRPASEPASLFLANGARRPAASPTYVAPSGEKLNPTRPEENRFYNPGGGQSVYIVQKVGSTGLKAFTGYGDDPTWSIGAVAPVESALNGRNLGQHVIIGKIDPAGNRSGVIPNKALPHSVFK